MPNDLHDLPINMPDDGNLESLLVPDVGISSVSDHPLIGNLSFVTKDGYYDFIINAEIANQLVQEARAFLRGDSPSLIEDAADRIG
jgi:hypothetical protein